MKKYILGIGSNIGDREKNLLESCFLLEKNHIKVLRASSIYESQPVDYPSQPWFLNQIFEVSTELLPDDLLDVVQKIEKNMGRLKSIPKGPRKIDIDIIFAGNLIHQTRRLEIPHPRMHKRNFVLLPLKELDASVIHPIFNKSVETLIKENDDLSEIRKYQSS